MSSGTFAPRPGAAPLPRMLAAQTGLELRLLLRNGEQLVLTLVLPVLLLLVFSYTPVSGLADGDVRAVDLVAPGILALVVLSTAFTGQAIATGFERRYGVLKRLGTTPLPRWGLLAAKTGAVLVVEVLQVALLVGVALALGWSPRPAILPAAVLLVLATAAFSALGLLMAGALRAEATLAAANLVYVLLLLGGGVVVPLDRYPAALRPVLEVTPLGALSEGLRDLLQRGAGLPWAAAVVLLAWGLAGGIAAARTFRWE